MPPEGPGSPSPEAAPAARKPGFVPGAKKARHLRLTRITKWVTVCGLVVVTGLVALFVFTRKPGGDSMVEGCRSSLAELAGEVDTFRTRAGRLPNALNELFSPESTSRFDAEPWDCWKHAFEYRIVDREKGTYRLRSRGPDGKPDTPDDIVWPPGEPWR